MSKSADTYFAPAKLNLFLHITGVRDDGMHNLQTLFQLLDYGDAISCLTRTDKQLKLHCSKRELQNNNNLVLRAARALQSVSGTLVGADIHLHKRIPIAAGLGGGSSDAATTLCVLNRLWGCKLNTQELAEIGESIGADIPVFVHGRSAWGEGIGDNLSPVHIAPAWYAIFIPPVRYTTASQFAHPQLKRNCAKVTMQDYLAGHTHNVFEPIARQHSEIANVMDWLNDFSRARLSGTGPCVYAAFPSKQAAHACVSQANDHLFARVARGIADNADTSALRTEP